MYCGDCTNATRLVCEKALWATATDVMEAHRDDGCTLEKAAPTIEFQASLRVARCNGMSEADIENVLNRVRHRCPEVQEPWRRILDQFTLTARLLNSDGDEVCRTTVTTTGLFWEEWGGEVLDDVREYMCVAVGLDVDAVDVEWEEIPEDVTKAMPCGECSVNLYWIATKPVRQGELSVA